MGTRDKGSGPERSAGTPARDPRFARRATLEGHLGRVNALIEVVDARAPGATHSEAFRTGRFLQKPRIIALSHADLADPVVTRAWTDRLGRRSVAIDAVHGSGMGTLMDRLAALEVRGEIRAMVVGLPNLGKSSLVNRLTGRARAHTGNRPGITVGEQWIEARPGLRLLDEPGLLPFRPGPLIAALGSVPEGRLTVHEIVAYLWGVEDVRRRLIALFAADRATPVEEDETSEGGPHGVAWEAAPEELAMLEEGLSPETAEDLAGLERYLARVAQRIGALGPGGRPERERAARHVLSAFRVGALGRLSLEQPDPDGQDGWAGENAK